jgi:hypothetical protein
LQDFAYVFSNPYIHPVFSFCFGKQVVFPSLLVEVSSLLYVSPVPIDVEMKRSNGLYVLWLSQFVFQFIQAVSSIVNWSDLNQNLNQKIGASN